jgi:hypothetical protein
MKSYLAIIIALSILVGCKDKTTNPITENGTTLTASTNKNLYAVNETLFVNLKNGARDTVYFFHCNYRVAFHIELKKNNEWTDAGSIAAICQGIYQSGIYPFPPSRSYSDSVALRLAGTYRLLFVHVSRDHPTTPDSLFTNEFAVQ